MDRWGTWTDRFTWRPLRQEFAATRINAPDAPGVLETDRERVEGAVLPVAVAVHAPDGGFADLPDVNVDADVH